MLEYGIYPLDLTKTSEFGAVQELSNSDYQSGTSVPHACMTQEPSTPIHNWEAFFWYDDRIMHANDCACSTIVVDSDSKIAS